MASKQTLNSLIEFIKNNSVSKLEVFNLFGTFVTDISDPEKINKLIKILQTNLHEIDLSKSYPDNEYDRNSIIQLDTCKGLADHNRIDMDYYFFLMFLHDVPDHITIESKYGLVYKLTSESKYDIKIMIYLFDIVATVLIRNAKQKN